MKEKRGAAGSLSVFLIIIGVVTIISYIYISAAADGDQAYGTNSNTGNFTNYNNTQNLVNISNDLNNQFNGVNTTGSGSSTIESFNQVYTLGIVSTRIIGTITPQMFSMIISTAGDTLKIPPVINLIAALIVTFLLVSYFLYVLLGRNL